MNENQPSSYSYLDNVRINEGIQKCSTVFSNIYKRNRRNAVGLLNDRRLTFPCLFNLLPQIKSLGLYRYLNDRNSTTVRIIDQILKTQDAGNSINYLSDQKDAEYAALKWMLETGHIEDGLNDEYERILDVTISVLTNIYNDASTLPLVSDMIFKRSKDGRNIHYLVWAFFWIRNPSALKLIAQRLRSGDQQDVELACSLLGIPVPDRADMTAYNQQLCEDYLQWLEDNDPFLYFTDESFQYSSQPVFYRIDLERKYINKGIPTYQKQPIVPANETENRCLAAFSKVSNEEKTILSEYSYKIHDEDLSAWRSWIERPIEEQLKAAKTERERTRWL